jgi:hypothetical protein
MYIIIHSNNYKDGVVVLTDHSATLPIIDQTQLNTLLVDRTNKKLIDISVYLSQYVLKIYHLAGKKNLIPDTLSRLATIGDLKERLEGIVTLD